MQHHDLRPVVKPARIRDLGPVSTGPLQPMVERLSDATWAREDRLKENAYFCFGQTRHIVFRFPHGNVDPRHVYSQPSWRFWSPLLMPVIAQAIAPLGLLRPEVSKAMLANLEPGGSIPAHDDGAGVHPLVHKLHVPLQTNAGARMWILDEWFHLQVGRAYEVNNLVSHAVENCGTTDRIHFIFEVYDAAPAEACPQAAQA